MGQRQGVGFVRGIVMRLDSDDWRASLAVPALELLEIGAVGVSHRCTEIVARDGVAVVAFEIQVHTLAEALAA